MGDKQDLKQCLIYFTVDQFLGNLPSDFVGTVHNLLFVELFDVFFFIMIIIIKKTLVTKLKFLFFLLAYCAVTLNSVQTWQHKRITVLIRAVILFIFISVYNMVYTL